MGMKPPSRCNVRVSNTRSSGRVGSRSGDDYTESNMFTLIAFIISFLIASVTAVVLHSGARRFVRDRLRYVDAVQKGFAPIVAGVAVFVVTALVAPILPFVGIGTALAAGIAAGSGVAAGARDIRKGYSPIVYGS